MAGVLLSEALASENMAEMSSTVVAQNFNPASVGIRFTTHGARDFIVESRPAAAGVEFVLRAVEWRFAAAADVGTFGKVLVVLAGEGIFRAFVHDDVLLLWREFIPFFFVRGHGLIF